MSEQSRRIRAEQNITKKHKEWLKKTAIKIKVFFDREWSTLDVEQARRIEQAYQLLDEAADLY